MRRVRRYSPARLRCGIWRPRVSPFPILVLLPRCTNPIGPNAPGIWTRPAASSLAHELHAPYVRVFPNQFIPGEDKRVTFARISEGLHELGEYARPAGVTVIVESHGDFRRGEDIIPILDGAESKNVAFLWDAHHTCVEGEKPADAGFDAGFSSRDQYPARHSDSVCGNQESCARTLPDRFRDEV